MTNPREQAIERISKIVLHLEAEVQKEDPTQGSHFAIIKDQQRASLKMWRNVLDSLLLDDGSVMRNYENLALSYKVVTEELQLLRKGFEDIKLKMRVAAPNSSEYWRGYYDALVFCMGCLGIPSEPRGQNSDTETSS